MSAVARVFDHPWLTIPNGDGTFAIEGVPAGAATILTVTLPVLEPAP